MYTHQISEHNKNLLDKVKQLNLPAGKYVIFGSGSLVVRGLAEGHDIDIVVTQEIFNEYKTNQTIYRTRG